MDYLIMQHPGHNRVYYLSADKMALAELKIASQQLSALPQCVDVVTIEGLRYLHLRTAEVLSEADIELLSRLSFVFALFRLRKVDEQQVLVPMRRSQYESIDGKISTIQKYAGKTNELFTRMMLNVALLSSDFSYENAITILDPVAGRGTTLFEAAVYGFDAYGIEIMPKSVHETAVFFKKFLENERLKHTAVQRQVSGGSKKEAVLMKEFKYNTTQSRRLGLVEGNTQEASKYFKANTFNLIVGDLPYGVAHGNNPQKKGKSITRNPSELLQACVADWHKVLMQGGVVVVAWNSFLVSREKLSEVFVKNGFQVLTDSPYDEFEHMVDQSIKRDIVVAKKG